MSKLEEDLTDSLYAVLLGEADWSRFLSMLVSDRIRGGAVFMLQNDSGNGRVGRLEMATGVDQRQISDYAEYYSQRNPWVPDHILRRSNDVIVDHEVISREELRRTEYYNDYLRPAGYTGSTGITLSSRGSEHMLLTTVFGDEDPEIASMMGRRLEVLKPHLLRVMRHYSQLGLETNPGGFAAEALGVLGTGLCVICDSLKPALITPAAEMAARQCRLFSITPTGRIRLDHETGQQVLTAMLNRDYAGAREMVWHQNGCKLTLFRAARDPISELLCGPTAGLIIEPSVAATGPDRLTGLQQRFVLTAAETRALEGISQGLSIRGIAEANGLSVETIRSQVKSLLHKTGSANQLALLRLLSAQPS